MSAPKSTTSDIRSDVSDFASYSNAPPTPKGILIGRGDVRLVSGRSRARPIAEGGSLPPSADVVVIGGGMVGAFAALTLAERGVSVVLCEKGVIAGEASGRAHGYLYSLYASPAKAELLARSKQLWAEMPSRVSAETGYRNDGILGPLETETKEAIADAWLTAMQGAPGFDGKILSSSEAADMLPMRRGKAVPSLHVPSDGGAEPVLAVPAIAEEARAKGAIILQNCAVRAVETQGGRVSGVVTENGRINCQSVIVAAGAWTPYFTADMSIPYAQADIYMSMMILDGPGDLTPNYSTGYGIRPRLDGTYSYGAMSFAVPVLPATLKNFKNLKHAMNAFKELSKPGFSVNDFMRELWAPRKLATDRKSRFEARRILMPAFNHGPNEALMPLLHGDFPNFANAKIVERWAGVMSPAVDGMPVISDVKNHPGLYVGSGFSNGFTFGPAAGEALADLATGRTPRFNLDPFRLSRFSDGSTLGFHM